MNIMELVRAAPTTEAAGDFVLFDDNRQFIGQFHTGEEVADYIRTHDLKCPALGNLGLLKTRTYTHINGDLYVF